MAESKITTYALDRWEKAARAIDDRWQFQAMLRLIAEVRRLRAIIHAMEEQQEIKRHVEAQMLRNKLLDSHG